MPVVYLAAWLALAIALAGLGFYGLSVWGRRRALSLGVAGLGLAVAAAVGLAVPADLLWSWVTPLREGGTEVNLRALTAQPISCGPAYLALAEALGRPFLIPLEGLLRLNLALAALNALLLAVVALEFLGGWLPALAVVVVTARTPVFLASGVSELPGPLLGTLTLGGVLCARWLLHAPASATARRHRAARLLAALTLTLCAALATTTRWEFALIGAPATALGWLALLRGPAWLDARAAALNARLRRLAAPILDEGSPRALLAALAAVALTFPLVLLAGMLTGIDLPPDLTAMVRALNPFDTSLLTLPAVLSLVVPLGGVALVLLGGLYTLRRWQTWLLLPVGFACVFKAYVASSHDGKALFEMFRYQTQLVGLTALLGLCGWRQVQVWFDARQASVGVRRWVALAAVCSLSWAYPGVLGLVQERNLTLQAFGDANTAGGLLSLDTQRELRFLAAARRASPHCTIVAPTARRFDNHADAVARHEIAELSMWSASGLQRSQARSLEALREVEAGRFAPEQCVHYLRGLDCHIQGVTGCEGDGDGALADAPVLARSRFLWEPYGEPMEWGPYESTIVLQLIELQPGSTPPPSSGARVTFGLPDADETRTLAPGSR